MSLVGLKSLFFRQALVPGSTCVKSSGRRDTSLKLPGPWPWDIDTREPLLNSCPDHDTNILSDTVTERDVESQGNNSKPRNTFDQRCSWIDARVISDATIGLSDGLTVPFALTAGLSALGSTKVVIYGGFAELIAGAISMGLGGYLGAKSEAASYRAQREEIEAQIANNPQYVLQDIAEIFQPYSVPKAIIQKLTSHLVDSPRLADFIMQFRNCAEEPAATRALISALTIATAYFLGGLLPLIPYFFVAQVYEGLYYSIALMIVALFVFGYSKTGVIEGWKEGRNIRSCCFGGVQMIVVGGAAALTAMGLMKFFRGENVIVPSGVALT